MTFAAPPFLLAAGRRDSGRAAHDQPAQGEGAAFPRCGSCKISVEKTRRRRRVQDVLLMVLRAAMLLLIASGWPGRR